MTGPAIDVRGLVKRFGARTAVDRVTLQVQEGEIAGFLGPNGSGKTTTMRVMCGLLTADAGGGTVLGHDILREAHLIRLQVGYMTQGFSLYSDLTIEENLRFVAGMYRLSPARRHVEEALQGLGLADRRRQLAGALSGGWRQRLALAACVLHRPRLLLLDEPTAGVDPRARREFWDELRRLSLHGVTVLVATHYMDEAERCHRINCISRGGLVATGTVEEVIGRSGLATFHVEGGRLAEAERRLRAEAPVRQVAAFGPVLHVVGRDAEGLERAVRAVAEATGSRASRAATSLEDAFVGFVAEPEGAER